MGRSSRDPHPGNYLDWLRELEKEWARRKVKAFFSDVLWIVIFAAIAFCVFYTVFAFVLAAAV